MMQLPPELGKHWLRSISPTRLTIGFDVDRSCQRGIRFRHRASAGRACFQKESTERSPTMRAWNGVNAQFFH